jgi:type II secretory pathway pseudopilin PulG
MNERKSFQNQKNIADNKNMNYFNKKETSNKKLEKICITNVNNLNNKAGITLIALVISIIVMLILAGVSLNATIGDNGIITQAQNATYMQSVAVLEEFFNNYYIENYENVKSSESKIEELTTFKPEWFYIPASEGIGGLRYIPDSDGNALYLIKKSNLPNEIKNQIKGGDAGNGSYTDYASLNDVYGITNDLKIYWQRFNNRN